MSAAMKGIAAVLMPLAVLAACDRDESDRSKIDAAVNAGSDRATAQATHDPARQPHPDDSNPLRRRYGDLDLRERFFGRSQTQGDWRAWRPCSQQFNGMPVASSDAPMLSRCAALTHDLLDKAHGAGVPEATAADVMDPQLSGARRGTP